MEKRTSFDYKEFMTSIMESSYDGIYITDRNTMTIYVNKAYEKMTGRSRSEYVGKTMDELLELGLVKTHISEEVVTTRKAITLTEELVSGKKVIITGSPVFSDKNEVVAVVSNIRDISEIISLEKESRVAEEILSLYKEEYLSEPSLGPIICESSNTESVFRTALKVSPRDSTVLITGETGVGKEVVAQYIHRKSLRKDSNYFKVDCGAIPEHLLEKQLFGYVGGSFAGADPEGRPGVFEKVNNGTLFLDNISEIPVELQAALLRVLQDGEIIRIGSTEPVKVNVRIIAASNRNLKKMIKEKTFRADLYYRLNVMSIEVPPLRERREDIPALAELFISRLNEKYGYHKQATSEFLMELVSMDWPGNIRELSNFIERQFILNESDILSTVYADEMKRQEERGITGAEADADSFDMNRAVASLEASLIKAALTKCRYASEAAKLLKISQPTFSRKYHRYQDMGLL
ncbi:sigma-54 interaction domain-containing protein [Gallibacter sp. Marseille-QA0791]|uniref:sigma-54 interaction domain-containing protein n=1 Tax=Gallibacter sp. Marseille-QA0791 TaxID=3378781 RepID=UPI003D0D88C3